MNSDRRIAKMWLTVIAALFMGAAVAGAGTESISQSQVSGSTDVVAGLVTQGFRGSTSNPPINVGTGKITCGDVVTTDTTNQHHGGTTVASDVLPGSEFLQSQNAYPQATTNINGAGCVLGGGLGASFYQILTAANLSGKTFTVVVNNTATTKTDGTDFTHSGTNSTEATNLAGAFSGLVGATATAVGNNVYFTPANGTYFIGLDTNATGTDALPTQQTCGVTTLTGSGNEIFVAQGGGGGSSLISASGSQLNIGGSIFPYNGFTSTTTVMGPDAWPQATSTQALGGNLNLAGGCGASSATIVSFSGLPNQTTILQGGFNSTTIAHTYTSEASGATGRQFNAVTSNNQTATNLAAAINANEPAYFVTAQAVGAVCYIYPAPGVFNFTVTTTDGGTHETVSNAATGVVNSYATLNMQTQQITNTGNISATNGSQVQADTFTSASGRGVTFRAGSGLTTNGGGITMTGTNALTGGNNNGGGFSCTLGNAAQAGTAGAWSVTAGGGLATSTNTGGTITETAGSGGAQSGVGGSSTYNAGAGVGTTSGAGGLFQSNGGAGSPNSSNNASGGWACSTGAPSGTGVAANDKINMQAGWTNASGASAQTMGDRLTILGHNITMSTTTATATTIVVLNVPNSGTSGGVIIQYSLSNTGSAIVPGTATGMFCVSCSNNGGTTTATAGALTGQAANVGAFTAFTAGTISTSVASQAVSIKIAPSWSAGTSTGCVCTINCFAFGKGVTLTPQ